jgi:SAM-dependent methyltransferase
MIADMSPGFRQGEDAAFVRQKVLRDLTDRAVCREVGADQIAYYRVRAPWFDDVYTCSGDYDRGPEANDRWRADLSEIEQALIASSLGGSCVELGAGTGYWSERVVEHVEHLWALDAVPEVLDIARGRLRPFGDKVTFEVVDLWRWRPTRVWDCALACFFFEHVPDEVFGDLLTTLHEALRPGGTVFVAEAAAHSDEPQVEMRRVVDSVFHVVERRRTNEEFRDAFEAAGFAIHGKAGNRLIHLVATRQ